MPALTDFARNKMIDALLRGQAIGVPATMYIGLIVAAGTPATPGVEVTLGSYARVSIASALASWSGTQGPATVVASNGAGGQVTNNLTLTWPAPTANWGTVIGMEFWDAAVAGNRWLFGVLAVPKTVLSGGPAPVFPPGSLAPSLS